MLTLHFTDFNVEHKASNNGECNSDFVVLYDGIDTSTPLLGKYCGNSTPPDITAISESFLLHLHTDESGTANGFKITWSKLVKRLITRYRVSYLDLSFMSVFEN